MGYTSLGGVVCSLNVREIDDVAAHAASRHERTSLKPLQLLAGNRRLFLGLSAPVCSSSFRTEIDAVQIRGHYMAVMLNAAV